MFLNSKTSLEALTELASLLSGEMDMLKKKAEENIPKIKAVDEYPSPNSYSWDIGYSKSCSLNTSESVWFKFYNYYGTEVSPSLKQLEERRDKIQELISALESAQAAVEEKNKEAIANNKLVRLKVSLMMEHVGIVPYYSEYDYPTTRHRKRDWVKKTAGYVSDLNRCVPIQLKGYKHDVHQLRQKLQRVYQDAVKVVAEKERAIEQEKLKKQQEHELALLRAKYCPDNAFASKEDIMDVILGKNKYLMLAHHLLATRNDWSEGFDMAEYGVSQFAVETEEDGKIVEELQAILDGDETDGRVFRDCEYGYGTLFAMVEDDALRADYDKLSNITS